MKNFLLYLGNDRAGSTWLHGELRKRPDCNFDENKELFFFQKWFPFPMGFDKSKYFQIIEELVSPESVLLSGDITPANAYASKDQLYEFKENMEKLGITVLPVMTLRDPVSHAISISKLQINMNNLLKENNNDVTKLASFVRDQLQNNTTGLDPENSQEILDKIDVPFRNMMITWRETVNNVEEVFGKIHFNFYETMFNENSIRDLFSYLQVPYMPVEYDKKVFSFGKLPNFSEEENLNLFENYPHCRENYDFAVERFGKDFIESIWWTPYK